MKTLAYAAQKAGAELATFSIDRREPSETDVVIDILFCGICHSDLHQLKDEWGGATFPMVPGHEIVGRVKHAGKAVTKFKTGDLVGVGCMVDSCRACRQCDEHHEQFCEKGCAYTYNGTAMDRTTRTFGGYSKQVVVTESFVLRIPDSLDPASAAPLLCAGVTTWSPLRQWGCKKGDRVGVVGLGGLGHMAVKLAASMGAEVTMLSTSTAKEADARRLGATEFAVTRDPNTFKRLAGTFDLLIDTISAEHDVAAHLGLLKPFGTMVLLGVPPKPSAIGAFSLIGGNKRLVGSLIGGIKETQEMLDYCGKHGIVSDVEVIAMKDANASFERMLKGDVRYRFVLDLSTLT